MQGPFATFVSSGQQTSSSTGKYALRVDPEGNVMSGQVDKRVLVTETGVRYRDLRAVDPLADAPVAVFIRDRALVVNVEGVRLIICHDQAFVLGVPAKAGAADGRSAEPSPKSPFVQRLVKHLKVTALEAEAESVVSQQSNRQRAEEDSDDSPDDTGSNELEPLLLLERDIAALMTDASNDAADDLSNSEMDTLMPFELRVLEAALDSALHRLRREVSQLEAHVSGNLDRLTRKVTRRELGLIRNGKAQVAHLHDRVSRIQAELTEILTDDTDMADMYLSRREEERAFTLARNESLSRQPHTAGGVAPYAGLDVNSHTNREHGRQGSPADMHSGVGADAAVLGSVEVLARHHGEYVPVRPVDPHEIQECEDMLESYTTEADYILRRLKKITDAIDDAEDYIFVELDNRRNELVGLNLVVGVIGTTFAFTAMTSGIFGQNFGNSQLDTSWTAFFISTFGSLFGSAVIFCTLLWYAYKKNLLFIPEIAR